MKCGSMYLDEERGVWRSDIDIVLGMGWGGVEIEWVRNAI